MQASLHYARSLALFRDRAHHEPVATAAIEEPVVIVRIEAEVVRAVAISVGRSRPIVADRYRITGRKKDGITISRALHFITFYSVMGSPTPSTIVPPARSPAANIQPME